MKHARGHVGAACALAVLLTCTAARAQSARAYVGSDGIPVGAIAPRIPMPPGDDPAVAAIFMDRALSYYAAKARDQRRFSGHVAFGGAAVLGSLGAFTLADARSSGDRMTGWSSIGLGALFLAGAVVARVTSSDLEDLEEEYAAWRRDEHVPAWKAVAQATARWSKIADAERTSRRWSGTLALVTGALGGVIGVYGTASAKDGHERTTAFTIGVESLALLIAGSAMLTSEHPTEAGWHSWNVYVRPLPADDARGGSPSFVGATLGATAMF